ncbi:glutaredoxin family protein [Variovorax sp. PCZ-1]|uniref:glutaredoxin family protein n=1 Tax=Variovorax sp. PCZ-1 TaxID=2835533 RepID=UPI001BCC54E3|nr:glutaredoxin family protein [Variovorax sp. PCZ-1]MBS7806345.1 glutaredoxin family protein [Variovorax sp. PCZ-1]
MKKIAFCAVFLPAIALFSSQISAQQLYRIVGPDGRVTFSDQPPPPSANAKVTTGRGGSFSDSAGGAALPFELRSVVQRFPVTLYTGKDCNPCDAGRNMLRNRGIPFTERTVESNDDFEALKRLSGASSLPLATVGSQQMKGFSDAEWTQFLDAAGYPKTSQLPTGYRNPAPSPMVARVAPAPAAAAAPAPAPTPAAAPAPSNPAGIRF